jgi:hypothetical protein
MQVVNVYLCRSQSDSAFSRSPFDNRLIAGGVVLEIGLILLISYTPAGNAVFGTAPIEAHVWLTVLPFALGMLAFDEARKAFYRPWPRRAR